MRRLALSLLAVLALAAPALAHGGSYRGPAQSGGPGGPPPGPTEDPSPVTAWETWWANNKYLHLELGEGMREGAGATTGERRGEGDGPAPDPKEIRAAQDAFVREAVVPVFLEALKDESFEVRTAAAIALGKSGAPEGAEPLRRAAERDDHLDVRDSALLGLGLLGRKESIPFLTELLRDEKPTTRHRSFAAFSLGLIGGRDAGTALVEFMRVPSGARHRGDAALLSSCFLAMGFTGDDAVVPVLREAAEDPGYDEATRAFVWLALGRAGDRGSMPLLVGGLESARTPVALQRAAAVSLGRLTNAKDTAAVAALHRAVTEPRDPLVRHFAAISLGHLRDPGIAADLRRLLEKADDDGDRAFLALALAVAKDAQAAPLIRKALTTERNHSLRGAYCIALGLLGDRGARAVLETEVKDRGAIWGQGYAGLAIGMARIHDSAPVLRAELEATNDPRLRANLAVGLGLLKDPAARRWFFATLRGKGTLYERGGAAMSLGLLRLHEAVPILVEVVRDRGEADLMRAYGVCALGILCDPADPPKLARFAIDSDYSVQTDPLNEVLSIY